MRRVTSEDGFGIWLLLAVVVIAVVATVIVTSAILGQNGGSRGGGGGEDIATSDSSNPGDSPDNTNSDIVPAEPEEPTPPPDDTISLGEGNGDYVYLYKGTEPGKNVITWPVDRVEFTFHLPSLGYAAGVGRDDLYEALRNVVDTFNLQSSQARVQIITDESSTTPSVPEDSNIPEDLQPGAAAVAINPIYALPENEFQDRRAYFFDGTPLSDIEPAMADQYSFVAIQATPSGVPTSCHIVLNSDADWTISKDMTKLYPFGGEALNMRVQLLESLVQCFGFARASDLQTVDGVALAEFSRGLMNGGALTMNGYVHATGIYPLMEAGYVAGLLDKHGTLSGIGSNNNMTINSLQRVGLSERSFTRVYPVNTSNSDNPGEHETDSETGEFIWKVQADEPIIAEFSLQNLGAIGQNVSVRLFLSDDKLIQADDFPLTEDCLPLEAGSRQLQEFQLTLPCLAPGDELQYGQTAYYVGAIINLPSEGSNCEKVQDALTSDNTAFNPVFLLEPEPGRDCESYLDNNAVDDGAPDDGQTDDNTDQCPGLDIATLGSPCGTVNACEEQGIIVCNADLPDYCQLPDEPTDSDGDGAPDCVDNCPDDANADQADTDGNGIGDACDTCADGDGDEVCDSEDNCPGKANADQADTDGDGIGDACDADFSDGDDLPEEG